MTEIHVNLKRFDIPKKLGGICPEDNPSLWMKRAMEGIISEITNFSADVHVVIFPPESLLATAAEVLKAAGAPLSLEIGSQGVYTEDVVSGGNFGAFTTSLPASAAVGYGSTYALVGHSEERLKLFSLFASYDPEIQKIDEKRKVATEVVNQTVVQAAKKAVTAGLKLTFCIGETAEERGDGAVDFDAIGEVLRAQIEGLAELDGAAVTLAYEPRWAIGPGKTPPGADYITEVAKRIKQIARDVFGKEVPVLYGGGLKAENAKVIGEIEDVDGGLIALTKFVDPIGFDPFEMGKIVRLFSGEGA